MKIKKSDLHLVALNQYVQTKFRSIIQKGLYANFITNCILTWSMLDFVQLILCF